jgi:chromosome segregation and condensation protein ScpB
MKEKIGVILNANKLENVLDILDDLAKLMDDRIVDLHEVKGGMQSRHAYIFYREKVWNAMRELKEAQQQEE